MSSLPYSFSEVSCSSTGHDVTEALRHLGSILGIAFGLCRTDQFLEQRVESRAPC